LTAIDRGYLYALLAMIVFPRAVIADIGPIVNPANGHAYYVTEGAMTWADAEAWAVSNGGHLVAINDAAEDAWIQSSLGLASGYYWLGGRDDAVEGSFDWVSGEPFSYQNFLPGQPDDDAGLGGNGDYLALSALEWAWLDTNGDFTGFVTGAIAEASVTTGVKTPFFHNPVNIFARPSVTSDRTILDFTLARQASVSVRVFNVSGRLVRELSHGTLGEGAHEFTWDTRDGVARRVPSGMYLVQLTVDGSSSTRKVIVVR
jgi:hypothetical protein